MANQASSILARLFTMVALCISVECGACAQTADTMPDKEQLSIALEYFSSGKYREALNLLTRLDKKYRLNARFKAYIGVCHFYEWNYAETCRCIDPIVDELSVYAPHERSIYYFADAESHFFLGEYGKAVTLYERLLSVCYDKEKGDAYFRIGFCYMQGAQWQNALDNLNAALAYYERFGYPADKHSRVVQIEKMIKGCERQTKVLRK